MKLLIIFFSILCFLPVSAEDSTSASADSAYQTRKKFDYFFLEAIRSKENGEHSNAFNALRHALQIDSTSSVVWAELSDYYLYLQLDSMAVEALQKAVRLNPDNFNYKVSLADMNRERGNIPEAICLYEELVKENPDKAELHFHLSNLYLGSRQIDKAIGSLNNLENNMGMNEVISMQKYKLYLSVDEKENALKEIEKLSVKFPLEAKYQILIGDFYLEEKEPEKALAYYEKACVIDPENPIYVVSMSNYYEQKGDNEAAAGEIEKALKNSSLDIEIQIAILEKYIQNLLLNKRDVKSANALFETLMAQHSQEKELNLMYGQFLASQNKWEEARFQFQIVTESNPENINAWRQLLNVALRQDSIDEIIRVCEAALIRFPEVPEFYFYKSSALYQKKLFEEALLSIEDGVKYVPQKNRALLSTFYGQLGDLYNEIGEKQKAYETYDKALEYNENNILVLNNYAYLLSLDKTQLDKAESMSSKCLKFQPKNPNYIDTYAWILFQKGSYSLSKFYIESAITNGGGESSDMLDHYGDILFKTGNTDRAVQQWGKALEMKEKNGETDNAVLKRKIENRMCYETEQ
ncbi:MAG: tetratricopeptide repeat protein [Dysgonamonadaceae bacterium]|jgi:tetratricopeptide (TPR) repeat protein|nr:tetratricopeptide repeat protein [Dysgonamonadaceae bacterium]